MTQTAENTDKLYFRGVRDLSVLIPALMQCVCICPDGEV